jgi:7,8-dihydro-6-hydroxymethylpterin-pyrophosphokinase
MDARNTSLQPVKLLIKIRRIEQLTEKARQLQIKIQPRDLNIGKTKL